MATIKGMKFKNTPTLEIEDTKARNIGSQLNNYTESKLKTDDKTIPGAINELKDEIDNNNSQFNEYQKKSDKSLDTNNKEIVGAINEVHSQFENIANQIENIGSTTDEQVSNAINSAIADGLITGSGTKTSVAPSDTFSIGTSSDSGGETGGEDTPVTPKPTTYSIVNTLTNCVNSNTATSIEENSSYIATINANEGYTLGSITVTMGGADISSTVVNSNTITISKVTGNLVITCTAKESFNLAQYKKTDGYYVSMKSIEYSTVRFAEKADYNVYSFPIKANTRYKITVEDTSQYEGYITFGSKLSGTTGNVTNALAIFDDDIAEGFHNVISNAIITEPTYEYEGYVQNGDIYVFTGYATYSKDGYLVIGLNPNKNPKIEEVA